MALQSLSINHAQLYPPCADSSSDSSQTSHSALTPDSDSEQDTEKEKYADIGGGEIYKMQRHARDLEKVWDAEPETEGEEDERDNMVGRGRRKTSISTVQSYQLYTPDEEKEVVRVFDRKLVLFVALLYMLSFLDRSNIGNARIAGLDIDLDLNTSRYEWVITAFYMAYISFEWMSILWRLIPAHIYITCLVLSWGVVASLQSVATSFAGLLVLRVLLGIGEAGFTGIPFYLSFFFKREELALRTGYFISAAPLASSFASALAWGILALGKHLPIASWRLLFLIEGFPSVLVAVVAYYTIPDSPSTAPYLTRRQKRVARLRLRNKTTATSPNPTIWATLLSPKTWLTALILLLTNLAFSSMPVFLPTIIHEIGHTPLISQSLCAPPYLFSFLIVILTAYYSDKQSTRSYPLIFHALLSAAGYGILSFSSQLPTSIRYAALFPACAGFFSVVTLIITWSVNNQSASASGGSISFAILQIVGQLGPLIGTRLYPLEDAPYYSKGMGVCAISMVVVAILGLGLRVLLQRENRRLEESGEEVVYGKIGRKRGGADSDRNRGERGFKYIL